MSALPRGRCPKCHRVVALRKGDLVREHWPTPNAAYVCVGSGMPAEKPLVLPS